MLNYINYYNIYTISITNTIFLFLYNTKYILKGDPETSERSQVSKLCISLFFSSISFDTSDTDTVIASDVFIKICVNNPSLFKVTVK